MSLALLAAVLVPTGPAQAAWALQVPITLQVYAYNPSGGTQMLGRAEGWMQFDDGGNTFRYSLTFCRQSSYQLPYLVISVNVSYSNGQRWATPIATVNPPYNGYSTTQPCYSSTGSAAGELTSPNFSSVEFQLFGSTFVGQSHTMFMEDQLMYNPY